MNHILTGNRTARALLTALAAGILLAAAPAQANKISERSKQKQAAESEHAELREKLANLKREINATESARTGAADALADSEAAISQVNRVLHELTLEQREVEARLAALSSDGERLNAAVAEQRARLSAVLREQYVGGSEDRIRLLLSGDNPNRINRDLQYLGYVSQAQARLINSLQSDLLAIEETVRRRRTRAMNSTRSRRNVRPASKNSKRKRPATRPCSPSCQASLRRSARKRATSSVTRNDCRHWSTASRA